jgi:hypothetical protein
MVTNARNNETDKMDVANWDLDAVASSLRCCGMPGANLYDSRLQSQPLLRSRLHGSRCELGFSIGAGPAWGHVHSNRAWLDSFVAAFSDFNAIELAKTEKAKQLIVS